MIKLRHLIICGVLSIFFSTGVLSQQTNGVQFFVNPYIQELGNLNNRYTSISCETVFSSYTRSPSMEFGALYHHNFKNKFGWGIGLSLRNAKSESSLTFSKVDDPNYLFIEYNNQTRRQFLSLKLQASYQLHDRISLNLLLNGESTWFVEESGDDWVGSSFGVTNHIVTPSGTVSTPIQFNDIRIRSSPYAYNIVPEINANFEIINGLNLNVGFRFKFWKDKSLTQSAVVTGFNGAENNTTNEIIFQSEIDNREYSIYFGVMYHLKKNKIKKSPRGFINIENPNF